MKINNLILISIFLIILTAGAVCAQENQTAADEVILNAPEITENVSLSDGDVLEDDDFEMFYDGLPIEEDDIKLGDNVEFSVQFYTRGVTGQIYVTVDNNKTQKFDVYGPTDNPVDFRIEEFGYHKITIQYDGNYPDVKDVFYYNVTDFTINVYPDDYQFIYGHDAYLNVDTLPGMTGEISIVVGNKTYNLTRLADEYYESYIRLDSNTLNYGDVITLNYVQGKNDRFWTKSFNYTINLTSEIIIPRYNWYYDVYQNITLGLPQQAQGKLYVCIDDGNEFVTDLVNGSAILPVSFDEIGSHKINATYVDSRGFNITSNDVWINVLPKLVYDDKIGISGGNLTVLLPENVTGTIELYHEDYLSDIVLTHLLTAEVIGGKAVIPLKLAEDDYVLLIKYNLTDYILDDDAIYLSVLTQNPNWDMDITVNDIIKSSQQYVIGLNNAHYNLKDNFILKIDENDWQYVYDGLNFMIDASDLEYGEHSFELYFLGDEYFNQSNASGVFNVTPIAVNVNKNIDLDFENYVNIILPKDATGTVAVSLNGKVIYNKNIKKDSYLFDGLLYLDVPLGDLKYGLSDIEVKYSGNHAQSYVKYLAVNVTYEMDLESGLMRYGETKGYLRLPEALMTRAALTIDGVNVKINYREGDMGVRAFFELPDTLEIGNHTAVLSYGGDSKYPQRIVEKSIEVVPVVYMAYKSVDGYNGLSLIMPENASGKLHVNVSGKYYGSVDAKGNVKFNLDNLSFGQYYITAFYDGDDYPVGDFTGELIIIPEFILPQKMIWKSNEVLCVDLPGSEGTLSLSFNEIYLTADLVDGKASIPLSGLPVGEDELWISFEHLNKNGGTDTYDDFITVNVINPIKANNLAVQYLAGNSYQVKIVDVDGKPVKDASVTFYIDNKKIKTAKTNSKGYASVKITKAPKTYKIKAVYNKLSVTKKLTVKHIVSLKKVSVKKSAKKLVLTAKLAKVNKKFLKGKKVIFKFNGKKYAAKTNAKGVVKVTIKNTVLKKLKAGKKITYSATYGKDTVKQSVKIKK